MVDLVAEGLAGVAEAALEVVGSVGSAAGAPAVAGPSAVIRKRESRWFRKN